MSHQPPQQVNWCVRLERVARMHWPSDVGQGDVMRVRAGVTPWWLGLGVVAFLLAWTVTGRKDRGHPGGAAPPPVGVAVDQPAAEAGVTLDLRFIFVSDKEIETVGVTPGCGDA